MIGDGQFQSQLEAIEAILKKLDLLSERQPFPEKSLGGAMFRGKPYQEVFAICLREFAYDFRLNDQSLLLFIKEGSDIHSGSLKYSYYEAPVSVISYRDFVLFEAGAGEDIAEETLNEWGDELRPEYESYVSSTQLKNAVTPVRYDCQSSDYRTSVHPASHFHFGVGNDIRVGTRRVLTPVAFTLFVLRQRYPAAWEKLLKWRNSDVLCRNIRPALDLVDCKYWIPEDERELYLV
jgi:hypothetical protein